MEKVSGECMITDAAIRSNGEGGVLAHLVGSFDVWA